MRLIEVRGAATETRRQRQAHALTLIVAAVVLLYGLNLRQSTLEAVVPYVNIQAGITAFYPQNWLLDTAPDYVFRVRDMTRRGYKTTIQLSVQPVSDDTSGRNIADRLALTRARTFTGYSVLAVEPYPLRDGFSAQAVSYTYVSQESSPFLQGIPVVVVGLDIITISRGQALVITFRADAATYRQELPRFEQFLQALEF
ncbi:MAG: hypothetical protein MUE40_01755 [Anaerolineae bacterium]|jgi:hypothetical protein|nr:hypothetical protein [Anaerolineae bacterium]